MAPPSGSAVDTTATAAAPQTPVAPEIHLETVMPAAGASSNQPGAPAGASSTPANGATASAPTTYTVPVEKNTAQPMRDSNAAASRSDAVQDTHGMVYAGAVYSGEPADNRSLAEIAAQYKRSRATQNARVFTNEDIQRLNARNDVNTMGANQDQTLPQGEGEVEATAPPQQPQQPVKGQKRSPFTPKQPK